MNPYCEQTIYQLLIKNMRQESGMIAELKRWEQSFIQSASLCPCLLPLFCRTSVRLNSPPQSLFSAFLWRTLSCESSCSSPLSSDYTTVTQNVPIKFRKALKGGAEWIQFFTPGKVHPKSQQFRWLQLEQIITKHVSITCSCKINNPKLNESPYSVSVNRVSL